MLIICAVKWFFLLFQGGCDYENVILFWFLFNKMLGHIH